MYIDKGFTLVEMLVVVAVISILASLAYPSYTDYLRKSRRIDAYTAIQQVAAAQERFYASRRQYASFADPFNSTGAMQSPDGFYTVAVVADNVARSYEITATPVSTKAQSSDSKCKTISLSSNGHKSSTGTLDDLSRGIECWR